VSRTSMFILVSAMAATLLSWGFASRVFHYAPITTDEQSYNLQAHLFAQGRLKYETPPMLQAFRSPMVILDDKVGWFSRYPPAHSFWLMPGVWFGSLYLMVALAAGLGVAFAALTARRLNLPAGLVGLGFLMSPFFLFTYGTLMSHTSGMMTSALMLFAYVLWKQDRKNVWAILAGLAWAFLFLNRTYTALLMAIPFALDSLWYLWRNRTRDGLIGVVCFAGAACTGIAVVFIYNYLQVGHPLRMTYLYYDPSDKLGFGMRHNWPHVFPAPKPVEHTWTKGLHDVWNNLRLLDQWLFGFKGGLWVWGGLVVAGWRRAWSPLLLASVVLVWIGYILFWYPGWNETGPNYYVETLPAMFLLAAFGIQRVGTWLSRWPRVRMSVAGIGLALWVFFFSGFVSHHSRAFSDQLAICGHVMALLDEEQDPSLVFIRREDIQAIWPNHDLVFNKRGLAGPAIVARWLPASNAALMRYFANHTPKILQRVDAHTFSLVPLGMDIHLDFDMAISSLFRETGTNEMDDSVEPARLMRVAREADHTPGLLIHGRHYGVYPGRFRVDFLVRSPGSGTAPVTFEVTAENAQRVLVSDEVALSPDWHTVSLAWDSSEFLYVEPRVKYHGQGNVAIASVRIYDAVLRQGNAE